MPFICINFKVDPSLIIKDIHPDGHRFIQENDSKAVTVSEVHRPLEEWLSAKGLLQGTDFIHLHSQITFVLILCYMASHIQ